MSMVDSQSHLQYCPSHDILGSVTSLEHVDHADMHDLSASSSDMAC